MSASETPWGAIHARGRTPDQVGGGRGAKKEKFASFSVGYRLLTIANRDGAQLSVMRLLVDRKERKNEITRVGATARLSASLRCLRRCSAQANLV
jgi:hypothetical protein